MAFRRISLSWKLPGIIALLLVLAVGGFGTVAYRSVDRAVTLAARDRLHGAADQLARLLSASFANGTRSLAKDAEDSSLVEALRRHRGGSRVSRRLAKLMPASASRVAVELRDSADRVVSSAGRRACGPDSAAPTLAADSVAVSKLFQHGDTVCYKLSIPVRHGGRRLGRLVTVQKVAMTPEAVQRVARLFGSEASISLGNADGSVWTDLVRRVPRPSFDSVNGLFERDGQLRLGARARVTGTPLVAEVDLPEAVLMEPVHSLTREFALLGIVVVLLGIVAGAVFSGGMIRPLSRLTAAAEAVAAGHHDVVGLATDRGDEIGRLSRSFQTMASSVHEAWGSLEHQVEERTKELRDAQEELVRKERLATLGQLSSSVGHELRNPLGVMTNAIYYLDAVLTDVPEKVTEYLEILRTQIHLSEKIVSDLLDFARVKAPQTERVAVRALVEEQLQRVDVPESVTVRKEIPEDMPKVRVDAVQVGQVLVNLFANAVQAMEEGGTLTIEAESREGMVRVHVSDSGPGVDDENRDKIFEPLFTTKARGIGLGLAVSRSLARANGGELTLDSQPGEGARFTVTMPTGGGV